MDLRFPLSSLFSALDWAISGVGAALAARLGLLEEAGAFRDGLGGTCWKSVAASDWSGEGPLHLK